MITKIARIEHVMYKRIGGVKESYAVIRWRLFGFIPLLTIKSKLK